MKSFKAPGIDGWRAQELKLLPSLAIQHLADIFSQIWDSHMTPNQMLARTILLAKTANPMTFSDGRPIAILGYVPRLTSKLIADQLLAAWGKRWSPQIAGGLPFRAIKDITMQQQFLIEKAHQTNVPYGGFTLDLVKAFNLIPRQVAKRLLIAWGAPTDAVSFWIRSLNNMSRILQVRGRCSSKQSSTTGAPEGDAMSVCAMLVIAATFFRKMTIARVQPFTYADNWTLMSPDKRALFQALIQTLNFATTIRMKIDIGKSWGWGTNEEMRKFWKSTSLLFPAGDVDIDVKLASKDLGCMMQYSRRTFLGCLKSRIQYAKRRLFRLQKMDLSIQDKASKIQTAIWPVAFYGAESQVIGETHFTQLRRAASDALIGKHKFASSFVAMQYLSDRIMDPMLYVIVSGLCAIRRLYHYNPQLADEMWNEVLAQATPRGPASALAHYLRKVQWTPDEGGKVTMPSGHQLNLSLQPTCEIRHICRLAWSQHVHVQICHRKGVTAMPFDAYTHLKVFTKLTAREQKILSLNVTGGFQTSATKAIWDSTQTPECQYCHQPDRHQHRLLKCPNFEHVRERHAAAIQTLHTHTHLCWSPLPTIHAKQHVYNLTRHNRMGPVLSPRHDSAETRVKIFTDGTCDRPKLQNCCRAAWAAVKQIHQDREDPSFNHFEVLQVSHVQGVQTINRSELASVAWVTQFYSQQQPRPEVDIYTDSQFVERLVQSIASGTFDASRYNIMHFDLIQILQATWEPSFCQIHKVKSHCELSQARNRDQLYTILGNTVADDTAKLINQQEMPFLQEACDDIAHHSCVQMQALAEIFAYLCELNSLRMTLTLEREKSQDEENEHNSCDAIAQIQQILLDWVPDGPFWTFDGILPPVIAHACPSGGQIARGVWLFFQQLEWRHPDLPPQKNDFGVTWYELTIHFTMYTGRCLPIWVKQKTGHQAWPYPFDSEEVAILKPEVRSLWHQAHNFRAVVKYLESSTGCHLYPRYKKTGASTMVRLGFHRSLTGGIA